MLPTTIAEYAYDPFGRRIKKTVSGITTHFHYDLQGRLIAETAGDGTALRDYIYQNGNLVALKLHGAQAGVYYVISDHLGTPQQIVDAAGTVVWKAAFLPFGKAQILTETISNNIRFPGQYFDAETGLHYNWNRYYDPDTGRYLTPDPIGLAGGLNLYAYVGGDPLNNTDPTGKAIALPALFVTTVALVGGYIYLQTHPDAVSDLADGISEFAKPSRKNDKEAATDIPSYVKYHPPKGPNESCGEYAERVLKDQFGCDDPRATRKGPRSDYSKIKKNCERSR